MTPTPPRSRRQLPIPLVCLTHPFELALGAALVANGLRGFLGAPSPSVADLPVIPLLMYLAISTLGGLGVIAGLVMNDPPQHHGRAVSIERASLYLVSASYAGFAILVIGNNGANGIPAGLVALVVGAACLFRAIAIRRAALTVLEELRRATRGDRHA